MGVDVHMRWKNQTEAEGNALGYIRGAGASQVLFAECWEPELLERTRRLLASEPVEPPPTITVTFDDLIEEDGTEGGGDEDPEIDTVEPESDDDAEGIDDDWKAFPAAVLRSREKAARRHVWAQAKLHMANKGNTDGEEVHQLFLERWLPYKTFIKLAEQKERETGRPVEVLVCY